MPKPLSKTNRGTGLGSGEDVKNDMAQGKAWGSPKRANRSRAVAGAEWRQGRRRKCLSAKTEVALLLPNPQGGKKLGVLESRSRKRQASTSSEVSARGAVEIRKSAGRGEPFARRAVMM